MLQVLVNGAELEVPEGETVRALITRMGLNEELVAVEINRTLVRKRNFDAEALSEGDRVEIVEFVGGG